MSRKRKAIEPKRRNHLVAHVMRKGVQRHTNRKRKEKIDGNRKLDNA